MCSVKTYSDALAKGDAVLLLSSLQSLFNETVVTIPSNSCASVDDDAANVVVRPESSVVFNMDGFVKALSTPLVKSDVVQPWLSALSLLYTAERQRDADRGSKVAACLVLTLEFVAAAFQVQRQHEAGVGVGGDGRDCTDDAEMSTFMNHVANAKQGISPLFCALGGDFSPQERSAMIESDTPNVTSFSRSWAATIPFLETVLSDALAGFALKITDATDSNSSPAIAFPSLLIAKRMVQNLDCFPPSSTTTSARLKSIVARLSSYGGISLYFLDKGADPLSRGLGTSNGGSAADTMLSLALRTTTIAGRWWCTPDDKSLKQLPTGTNTTDVNYKHFLSPNEGGDASDLSLHSIPSKLLLGEEAARRFYEEIIDKMVFASSISGGSSFDLKTHVMDPNRGTTHLHLACENVNIPFSLIRWMVERYDLNPLYHPFQNLKLSSKKKGSSVEVSESTSAAVTSQTVEINVTCPLMLLVGRFRTRDTVETNGKGVGGFGVGTTSSSASDLSDFFSIVAPKKNGRLSLLSGYERFIYSGTEWCNLLDTLFRHCDSNTEFKVPPSLLINSTDMKTRRSSVFTLLCSRLDVIPVGVILHLLKHHGADPNAVFRDLQEGVGVPPATITKRSPPLTIFLEVGQTSKKNKKNLDDSSAANPVAVGTVTAVVAATTKQAPPPPLQLRPLHAALRSLKLANASKRCAFPFTHFDTLRDVRLAGTTAEGEAHEGFPIIIAPQLLEVSIRRVLCTIFDQPHPTMPRSAVEGSVMVKTLLDAFAACAAHHSPPSPRLFSAYSLGGRCALVLSTHHHSLSRVGSRDRGDSAAATMSSTLRHYEANISNCCADGYYEPAPSALLAACGEGLVAGGRTALQEACEWGYGPNVIDHLLSLAREEKRRVAQTNPLVAHSSAPSQTNLSLAPTPNAAYNGIRPLSYIVRNAAAALIRADRRRYYLIRESVAVKDSGEEDESETQQRGLGSVEVLEDFYRFVEDDSLPQWLIDSSSTKCAATAETLATTFMAMASADSTTCPSAHSVPAAALCCKCWECVALAPYYASITSVLLKASAEESLSIEEGAGYDVNIPDSLRTGRNTLHEACGANAFLIPFEHQSKPRGYEMVRRLMETRYFKSFQMVKLIVILLNKIRATRASASLLPAAANLNASCFQFGYFPLSYAILRYPSFADSSIILDDDGDENEISKNEEDVDMQDMVGIANKKSRNPYDVEAVNSLGDFFVEEGNFDRDSKAKLRGRGVLTAAMSGDGVYVPFEVCEHYIRSGGSVDAVGADGVPLLSLFFKRFEQFDFVPAAFENYFDTHVMCSRIDFLIEHGCDPCAWDGGCVHGYRTTVLYCACGNPCVPLAVIRYLMEEKGARACANACGPGNMKPIRRLMSRFNSISRSYRRNSDETDDEEETSLTATMMTVINKHGQRVNTFDTEWRRMRNRSPNAFANDEAYFIKEFCKLADIFAATDKAKAVSPFTELFELGGDIPFAILKHVMSLYPLPRHHEASDLKEGNEEEEIGMLVSPTVDEKAIGGDSSWLHMYLWSIVHGFRTHYCCPQTGNRKRFKDRCLTEEDLGVAIAMRGKEECGSGGEDGEISDAFLRVYDKDRNPYVVDFSKVSMFEDQINYFLSQGDNAFGANTRDLLHLIIKGNGNGECAFRSLLMALLRCGIDVNCWFRKRGPSPQSAYSVEPFVRKALAAGDYGQLQYVVNSSHPCEACDTFSTALYLKMLVEIGGAFSIVPDCVTGAPRYQSSYRVAKCSEEETSAEEDAEGLEADDYDETGDYDVHFSNCIEPLNLQRSEKDSRLFVLRQNGLYYHANK